MRNLEFHQAAEFGFELKH